MKAEWEERFGLVMPNVSVFDPDGRFPLNLQRTDLAQARYPFDDLLAKDVILDCIGNHSLSACRRVLNPNGKFVIVGASKVRTSLSHALKGLVLSWFVSQNFVMLIARLRKDDLTILGDLIQTGKVTPVIDKFYTLSEVPEAIRHLEQGHAQGKIVITV